MEEITIILLFIFFGGIALYIFIKNPLRDNYLENNINETPLIDQKIIDNLINERARIVPVLINEYRDEIIDSISPYLHKLKIKFKQLVYIDFYEDYNFDSWFKEQDYFINSKIWKTKNKLLEIANDRFINLDIKTDNKYFSTRYVYETCLIKTDFEKDIHNSIVVIIDELIRDKLPDEISEINDPIQFENLISKKFIINGWKTMETSRTGDQGADVIAEKNGKKIIVQCKLYSKPVGNKAVQEVFAAKQFYNGDLGIVITNNDYTKSARQLANSTNII